jgi:hypothetical protein
MNNHAMKRRQAIAPIHSSGVAVNASGTTGQYAMHSKEKRYTSDSSRPLGMHQVPAGKQPDH